MNRPRTSVIVRWTVAGVIGLAVLRVLVRTVAHAENMISAFGGSLLGLALLITAC